MVVEIVRKQAAVRQASAMASRSRRVSYSNSAVDYIKAKRSAIDFQILALQAEVKILEELHSIANDDDFLLSSLFQLLDTNTGDDEATIDGKELANGLKTVKAEDGFAEKVSKAVEAVPSKDNQKITEPEFKELAKSLVVLLECTYQELADIIVMSVLFGGGNSLSAAMESAEKLEKAHDKQELRKVAHDARMKSLYKLFDFNHDGTVSFKEVVFGLYKLTEDLDGTSHAAVNALLVLEEQDARSLGYEDFAKLIMNVVAAHPDHVKFDDIADKLTMLATQPVGFDENDISHLFAMDRALEFAMEQMNSVQDEKSAADTASTLSTVESLKANHLFKLWDLNKENKISFQELSLGLRKFHETTSLKDTVAESIKILSTFDVDRDQQLDIQEFTAFLIQFANLTKSEFMDMLDFMIVTTALKENSASEKAYLSSFSAGDIYYMGC